MSTAKIQEFESQVERLVLEHIETFHRAAVAAVERAFAKRTVTQARPATARVRTPGARRAPQEVAALAERLYEAVCAHPGAAMATLAARVGVTPRALNRPVIQLRRSGRLRSVGQRQATRYFPMRAKK